MQYNKEEPINAMNINYNVYYQNFINVNNIVPTNSFPIDEKLINKSHVFHQEGKSDFTPKYSFNEKAKPFISTKIELNSRMSSFSGLLEDNKESPTLLNKRKTNIEKATTKGLYELREENFQEENLTEIIGAILIALAAIIFITMFYGMFASKWIGNTGNYLLDFIAEDDYYYVLFPLLIPATIIAIYSNWVSMKFFRHS